MQSAGRSSSASPSSSSSSHLGLDQIHQQQQQQQLAYRQSLQQQLQQQQQQQFQQQQQLRKGEGEDSLLPYQHGVTGGSNYSSSSSSIPMPQAGRKFSDLPPQHSEYQNKGQAMGQQMQNPMHQAYLQHTLQTQHKFHGNLLMHQHGPSGRDREMVVNNFKMQDHMSLQAAAQSHGPVFKKPDTGEKKIEHGQNSNEERNELKSHQVGGTRQLPSVNMIRPVQLPQSQASTQHATNNKLGMGQWQAFQAWARDNNIDLSVPANMTLMNQLLPLWQSARMAALQKQNETPVASQSNLPSVKNQVLSSSDGNENAARGTSAGDVSGQAGPVKGRQIPSGSILSGGATMGVNSNLLQMRQQPTSCIRENQNEEAGKSQRVTGNGGLAIQLSQTSGSLSESMVQSNAKNASSGPETLETQQLRSLQQMSQPISQPGVPSSEGAGFQMPPQGGSVRMTPPHLMFTKQQLHVLKAQILAFRRIKRGERNLPPEVLQAIVPPPLDLQFQQTLLSSGIINQKTAAQNNVEEHAYLQTKDKVPQLTPSRKGSNLPEEELPSGEDKVAIVNHMQRATCSIKGPSSMHSVGDVEHNNSGPLKPEKEAGTGSQSISAQGNYDGDKGKSVSMNSTYVDSGQVKKDTPSSSTPPSKDVVTRKYHGPLFDFPSFTRKLDSGATTANYSRNMPLVYDVKDLLTEEGKDVVKRKRTENIKKISGLLTVNLERKSIKPDLILRLQIEERKLRLLELQARLRDEVDQEQQEIMVMPDRPYRTFVRQCERQRIDLSRQVQQLQKVSREKQLKSIFQWRKKLLEAHWAIRDARTSRNRGVAKYHEGMLREFSKRKDDDRNKRMEALKNNDVDRYRQILMEQQTGVPGDAAQRYSVLSSFLSQTEEYLHKLGGKITAAKTNQEVEEAANVAARAARSQGLSEEEVKAAAACAREEVMIRNRFSEMNTPKDSSSVNKYYNLAHAVNERVVRQPSMLRTGTLRDYQLVGLQWMLSLYNNKLNGILADEMGLGKTVQVMALIAYLMEFKGNYGPHLIIVPNAVLVNWKSELLSWLPSITCIFYVGAKDQRSKLFSNEVVSVKFNVLVTTYEFVMYDRSKLSKINWKYIVIDEAQRMKDRESVLARDLDRYRCQRRLLLTGTPLQNDLKELWSLLNLLLPEVFDNRKAFHDWFAKPFQKDGPSHSPEEDDWLETEKKVIIIHRLHQILEPFMLRRRVEDVEGSLPRKVSIVLRCRMSAIQGAVYDWIKSTGTVRVDPEDEMRRVEKNPMYQVKTYKNLNNKCMELRKVCNHPLLNYPFFNDYSKDFIVRSCGKLWVLDRILIKLQRAGHRVLLFSTMTKLLDILEEYLQWKRLTYRRIDGTTSLEDRESAIVDFNRADSNCFIFLLSIRAAGRGLNLQTADTVVIYDPDPNPQNEEQAVARAHRIGQKREVKVIYMEAVVDKISSFQKEDEWRNGGTESEDDLVGKDRYIGSIESLIRSNIQQYKLDMADEVINAGRFDQRTTHEERRMTLETLLHDEERYQENVHDVPSLQEVNRMIARSDEEVELFDQMDEELDWAREMVKYNQVPKWLRAGSKEVNAVVASLSKKPSKNILTTNNIDSSGILTGLSPRKIESERGRPKRTTIKQSIYREYDEDDDDDGDHSDAISEEGKEYLQYEDGERGEFEYEEVGVVTHNDKDQSDEEGMICEVAGYESSRIVEGNRSIHMFEEAGSTGSSGSRRLREPATPSTSSRKFGSLAALDTKPGHISKKMQDELEEGEIAVSGDSHMDLQQSDSGIHEHDDGEEEHVLQLKIKRKRSTRTRPRYTSERHEEKASSERAISHYDVELRTEKEALDAKIIPDKNDMNIASLKQRHNFASRKVSPLVLQKSGRLNYMSESAGDITDHSNWTGKSSGDPSSLGSKMSDSTQRKCKNVISKFQRRIDRDGQQIIPLVYGFWKRNETASHMGTASSLPDLQRIEQRVDGSEYNGVMDFVADVQLMLKNVVRYNSYSHEIRNEAGKLQDLFFSTMKIAFPDTDFRESKNAVAFSGGGGPAVTIQSLKQVSSTQGKQHAQMNKVETEFRPPKSMPRGPDDDEGRSRGYTSKPPKEPSCFPTSSVGTRDCEQPIPESTSIPAHPGDLVICKKKRKDRDKQKAGPTSPPPNPGRIGPLSPAIANPGIASGHGPSVRASSQKDALRPIQQDLHPTSRTVGSSVADIQWAKPVKRLRTDKRRPSHS